jgi:hypothetical protein
MSGVATWGVVAVVKNACDAKRVEIDAVVNAPCDTMGEP